jgi:Tetracyclin repressor-like, C-terminal domain
VGDAIVEIFVAILAAYQLQADDALHAVRALRSIMHGFITLELAGGFGLPLDLNESYRRLIELFIAGLHHQMRMIHMNTSNNT